MDWILGSKQYYLVYRFLLLWSFGHFFGPLDSVYGASSTFWLLVMKQTCLKQVLFNLFSGWRTTLSVWGATWVWRSCRPTPSSLSSSASTSWTRMIRKENFFVKWLSMKLKLENRTTQVFCTLGMQILDTRILYSY